MRVVAGCSVKSFAIRKLKEVFSFAEKETNRFQWFLSTFTASWISNYFQTPNIRNPQRQIVQ